MSGHSACYGTMFPDFVRIEKNKPLNSPAFMALVVSQGIGVQGHRLEVKPEGWNKCLGCAAYKTCYDLSFAKLIMSTILANAWYGA